MRRRASALFIFLYAGLFYAGLLSAQAPELAVVDGPQSPFVSIAVMKFSTHAAAEYSFLGDSTTETLSTKLARLEGIKLYERSQFAKIAGEYKLGLDAQGFMDQATLSQAGKVVSIDYMVLGAVTLAGGRCAVSLRLTELRSSRVILACEISGAYPTEFFDIQEELALKLAQALKLKLSSLEREALSAKPTSDIKVFDEYNRALAIGKLSEKILALKALVQRNPDFLQALNLLADSYWQADMLEEAKAVYDVILRKEPGFWANSYNRALLLLDMGRYQEAIADLGASAGLSPQDPDILYNLGYAKEFNAQGIRQGEGAHLKAALDAYEKALRLAPNHLEARFSAGLLCALLAQEASYAAEQKRLLTQALVHLEAYLRIYPDVFNAEEVAQNIILFKDYIRQLEGL